MDSKTEQEYISFVTNVTFLASSTDWNSDIASLFNQLFSLCISKDAMRWEMDDLVDQIHSLNPRLEFLSLTDQIFYLMTDEELDTEWKILLSLITQMIFLVSSMNLDSESKLVSPIKEIISFFSSKPDSESELVSLITQTMRLDFFSVDSDLEPTQESELLSLINQVVSLKPEPELTSLIRQTMYHFRSMNWEPLQLISFCPQAKVEIIQGKYHVLNEDVHPKKIEKGECYPRSIQFSRSTTENFFHCQDCNGKNHEEYDKVLVDVRHSLHPKHSLQLARLLMYGDKRECYCCDNYIEEMFYYCSACDFAMTLECVKKPLPALSIDVPKWHDHPLALFPSQTSYPCSLCALTHSSCPLCICPPCDFVVHQNCLSLPKVIKISRHPHHRISFTSSFTRGDKYCCGVCRQKIENDYGCYSCIKEGCPYAAHSKCATQSNVWDGKELEGVPEEIKEVLEPFVRISDGIIHHFSHQQHHLEFDENANKDYDGNKLCQACITPIYFGNIYSCMECDFVIHEKCANLSRKIYHPTHPHRLSLEVGFEDAQEKFDFCSICDLRCIGGCMFYKCAEEGCSCFKMHVQCATTLEPFINESHMHPLFLTSKPDEKIKCMVCKCYRGTFNTFNCIEDECDFSLCFGCATIPQKVRYKHDKHILTLSYGEDTSTMTYWCEVCEDKVNPQKRFYKCDEYCCITIHIKCLIGKDLYMKPGSSWFLQGKKVCVLPNNQISRPFCSRCKKRCPYKIVFRDLD